ncbi:MAG: helix-turn-helix transcriptional regulator [Spongiibacteraceae bacterium]
MGHPAEYQVTVEAELRAPVAMTQVVHFLSSQPADNLMRTEDVYRLDLCLSPRPRNVRACYSNRWNPHRFERIGNVFLVPPGEAMRVRSDDSCRQSSVLCHINPDPMRQWLEADWEWSEPRLAASLDIRDANIRGLLLRLGEEARNPGFASEMLVELIAAQLSIELSRYYRALNPNNSQSGLAGWRLRVIDERLQEVRAAPTLTELAELCRLSVRQLTRGFRASRGCSIGDYVATSRVEHAKRLLAGDESIKSIAYSLGFSTPSSFCFAFRRATGKTPREFRHGSMCDA